ncbi:hypothetical protein [Fimbriiglobus ruber]|uniref:VWFA domain-containing protein n=1 Tax=Fimbriiglobus ruber TaxID=1908690 RepID=A0A225DSC0_9BACT|nr:hypothetical protein [Fimbriiglobus ruber]OWK44312.1 hypothetical protein FRUB_02244 [Fimbriiglobus ruber]
MNETGQPVETEFVLRRLADPYPLVDWVPLFPAEYSPALWIGTTALAVLAGVVVTVFLYLRDARRIGLWAIPLTLLRVTVFALLGFAFLLPAFQKWETTEKRSRVLVILDVSPSMTQTSDEVSSVPSIKPKTRMQKLLDVLTDNQVGLVKKLLEKNPVYVYRFGSRLDDETQTFERDAAEWSKAEWDSWVNYDFKPWALRGVSPAGQDAVKKTAAWKGDAPGTPDWAVTWGKLTEGETIPADLSEDDKTALRDNRAKLDKRVDVARSIVLGTNVPDSLTSAVNREAANMVQGIVVFSDGRSNLGTDAAYRTLRERATQTKIPVFTVAVGEARENVSIGITDVQAPDRAPPDEQFKVVVEADGNGLADAEVDVRLNLFLPGRDPKKDQSDHELTAKLKFQGDTSPPHGTVDFVIDPDKLPDELTEPSKKIGKKRQLKQGAWSAVAKITRDKREVFPDPDHASPPRVIQVIDKPLRVLLFASAATREYQTIRTLLIREVQQNRAELSICLQNEGGRDGSAVQDVPPERLLSRFPTRLDTVGKPGDKPEEKYYNLNEYDLVIGFDPDWSELSADQVKNLQTWVDNLGGGLIYVAGPLNTYQLARADESGRLKPLLDIIPVLPDDIILLKTRPIPRTPRRLTLKPNPEYDVLKLDDDKPDDPVAGWESFFTGHDKYTPDPDQKKNVTPTRGIYSYYPVKQTKPGSSTLAELVDVKDTGEPDPKPWLVTAQPARGRTVFLGSGEIWRLRAFNLDFYDRFWVKLSRYAAANRDVKASRGRVLINKEFLSGAQVRVQARLLAPNGAPYETNAVSPKFVVSQLSADGTEVKKFGPFEMKARKSGIEFDGYYGGQVTADPTRFPPGDSKYRVTIDVPDSPGDTITGEFSVKKSDPELDNTRPDFAALELAAGTLEEVRGRIKDPAVYDRLKGTEHDPAKVKLAYRLAETEKIAAIPACIDNFSQTERYRGATDDIWDKPARLQLFGTDVKLLEFSAFGKDVKVGWMLLLAAAVLSLEWLGRKLLRLA